MKLYGNDGIFGNVWSYCEYERMYGNGHVGGHVENVQIVLLVFDCGWLVYFLWDYKSVWKYAVTIQRRMSRDYVYDL